MAMADNSLARSSVHPSFASGATRSNFSYLFPAELSAELLKSRSAIDRSFGQPRSSPGSNDVRTSRDVTRDNSRRRRAWTLICRAGYVSVTRTCSGSGREIRLRTISNNYPFLSVSRNCWMSRKFTSFATSSPFFSPRSCARFCTLTGETHAI